MRCLCTAPTRRRQDPTWQRRSATAHRVFATVGLLLVCTLSPVEVYSLRVKDVKNRLGIGRRVDTSAVFDKKYFQGWDELCHSAASELRGEQRLDDSKFSVLISTFHRVALTKKLLHFYAQNEFVEHIYVTWHDIKTPPPQFPAQRVPVTILQQRIDSLNNRFNPIPGIKTAAVLIADDDIELESMEDLTFGFTVWQDNQDRLVGYFPRSTAKDPATNQWSYKITDKMSKDRYGIKPYNIMLTKLMFMHTKYLFLYRCMMKRAVQQFVDKNLNCEDIAMNFLVTGITKKPPLAVLTWNKLLDYGLKKDSGGIWTKRMGKHFEVRSECVNTFINMYGANLLKDTTYAAGRFKGTWWEERDMVADNR